MTGPRDYLLRVVAEDLGAYERFLKQKLTRLDGIASIEFELRAGAGQVHQRPAGGVIQPPLVPAQAGTQNFKGTTLNQVNQEKPDRGQRSV